MPSKRKGSDRKVPPSKITIPPKSSSDGVQSEDFKRAGSRKKQPILSDIPDHSARPPKPSPAANTASPHHEGKGTEESETGSPPETSSKISSTHVRWSDTNSPSEKSFKSTSIQSSPFEPPEQGISRSNTRKLAGSPTYANPTLASEKRAEEQRALYMRNKEKEARRMSMAGTLSEATSSDHDEGRHSTHDNSGASSPFKPPPGRLQGPGLLGRSSTMPRKKGSSPGYCETPPRSPLYPIARTPPRSVHDAYAASLEEARKNAYSDAEVTALHTQLLQAEPERDQLRAELEKERLEQMGQLQRTQQKPLEEEFEGESEHIPSFRAELEKERLLQLQRAQQQQIQQAQGELASMQAQSQQSVQAFQHFLTGGQPTASPEEVQESPQEQASNAYTKLRLAELQYENGSLLRDLERANAKRSGTEGYLLKKENERLQKELQDAKLKNELLEVATEEIGDVYVKQREGLDDAVAENEKLQKELDEVKAANERLDVAAEEARKRHEKDHGELETAQREYKLLKESFDEEQREHQALMRKCQKLTEERTQLRVQVTELGAAKKNLEEKNMKNEDDHEAYVQDLAVQLKAKEQAEQNAQSLGRELEKLPKTDVSLLDDLQEEKSKNQEAKSRISILEAEKKDWIETATKLEAKIENLQAMQADHEKFASRIKYLEDDLSSLRGIVADDLKNIDEYHEIFRSDEDEPPELNALRSGIVDILVDYTERHDNLKEQKEHELALKEEEIREIEHFHQQEVKHLQNVVKRLVAQLSDQANDEDPKQKVDWEKMYNERKTAYEKLHRDFQRVKGIAIHYDGPKLQRQNEELRQRLTALNDKYNLAIEELSHWREKAANWHQEYRTIEERSQQTAQAFEERIKHLNEDMLGYIRDYHDNLPVNNPDWWQVEALQKQVKKLQHNLELRSRETQRMREERDQAIKEFQRLREANEEGRSIRFASLLAGTLPKGKYTPRYEMPEEVAERMRLIRELRREQQERRATEEKDEAEIERVRRYRMGDRYPPELPEWKGVVKQTPRERWGVGVLDEADV